MIVPQWWASSLTLASLAMAQFPPTPEGIVTKQVPSHPGVSISYKETTICETKAKAWAGYVHMPSSYLENIETANPYNISMFFWYFDARVDPENAPTAVYLAGGPGESSMDGAASDGGPCTINADSNSTSERPNSMNNNVNMLYVDQPVGVGFSYTTLINSTLDLLFVGSLTEKEPKTGIKSFESYHGNVPAENATFRYGTLTSQNPQHTANSTAVAAATFWKFAQVWFSGFPEYTTTNKRVSLWGQSYGGFFVTAFGAYIKRQNLRIQKGDMSGKIIDIDGIGLINGCVDELYESEPDLHLPYHNVYDFQIATKTAYEEALHNYTKPQGCLDLLTQCRRLGEEYDPEGFGINSTVNKACIEAQDYCRSYTSPYNPPYSRPEVGIRSSSDMAHLEPEPFPHVYTPGFFNQEWVQKDLGVPINFTEESILVIYDFILQTGDFYRYAGMKNVEYLLDNEVKVTFIYGDRDYKCPWLGVEKVSLAANWSGADTFRNAGYAYIHTNDSYDGGLVRQYGNLSFSRVFQAGHDAYVYQPETVWKIFNRATFNTDIATGSVSTAGAANNYSTSGPLSCEHIKDKLPTPPPPPSCYTWTAAFTCTNDQLLALQDGSADVVDYRVVKPKGGGGVPGFSSPRDGSSTSPHSNSQASAASCTTCWFSRDVSFLLRVAVGVAIGYMAHCHFN